MNGRNEDTAVLSLLSLSSSAPVSGDIRVESGNASSTAIPIASKPGHRRAKSRSRRMSDARDAAAFAMSMSASPPAASAAVSISSSGKKVKGGAPVDHVCETCSKVYRHPSCLIKHRWEHTPHWRESSKYVLSKHQQVQLLEAAAILSHLSPKSESLPEDRSLWPSFLSGGSVPTPSHIHHHEQKGPRMHDFTVSGNATRTSASPGVVGVSYSSSSTSASSFTVATPPIGYGRYASVRVKQEDESEDEEVDDEHSMDFSRNKQSDVTMDDSWDGEMEMEMD